MDFPISLRRIPFGYQELGLVRPGHLTVYDPQRKKNVAKVYAPLSS
jgi:hypothetical protein